MASASREEFSLDVCSVVFPESIPRSSFHKQRRCLALTPKRLLASSEDLTENMPQSTYRRPAAIMTLTSSLEQGIYEDLPIAVTGKLSLSASTSTNRPFDLPLAAITELYGCGMFNQHPVGRCLTMILIADVDAPATTLGSRLA